MPLLLFLIFAFSLFGGNSEPSALLLQANRGDVKGAIDRYLKMRKQGLPHQSDTLEQLGLILLKQGFQSSDQESKILTLFSCGVSLNDKAVDLLEEAIFSKDPQIQYIALNVLAKCGYEGSTYYIQKAATSPHPLIQLEAIHLLLERNDPKAYGQIEAFMQKVPPALTPIFPSLLVQSKDPSAKNMLKKLLHHQSFAVRIETILQIVRAGRDDFLPIIRKVFNSPDSGHLEACLLAFTTFKDASLIEKIKELSESKDIFLKLASLRALYVLGESYVLDEIVKEALLSNPYAITLLGDLKEGKEALALLLTSPYLSIRANASLSLLTMKDPRAKKALLEVLVDANRSMLFVKMSSAGKTVFSFRPTPRNQFKLEEIQTFAEMDLRLREEVLQLAFRNLKPQFSEIATHLFESEQNDLIPSLIHILVEWGSEEAAKLLETYRQRLGAPFIRCYCELALYQMNKNPESKENLLAFVREQEKTATITFRPHLTREAIDYGYRLTPSEKSQLLLEIYETFAKEMTPESIDLLLESLKEGHPFHRPFLAALLMRASL